MSTRTYNLQMRIGSGLAAQSSSKPTATHSHIPIAHEVTPHVADAQLKTDATVDTWSYSDVVASRPPSPQEVKETMSLLAGSPSLNEANRVLKTQSAALKLDSSGPNESLLSDLSDFPKGWECWEDSRALLTRAELLCSLADANSAAALAQWYKW